jgi:uracil-DNA glycosylase
MDPMNETGALVDENRPSSNHSVAYLATVLGIESVLLPVQTEDPASIPASPALSKPRVISTGLLDSRLVFVVENPACLDGEAGELLEKMILAMKQQPAEVLKLAFVPTGDGGGELGGDVGGDVGGDSNDAWIRQPASDAAFGVLNQAPRGSVVIFGDRAATTLLGEGAWPHGQWLATSPGIAILVTNGVSEILARPELKRTVWTHLQMAMKKMV